MSLRKFVKRVGRKAAPVAYKVGRVVTPVVGAVAGYFAGPVGGAVVGAIGGSAGYYARATAARADGTRGRAAREMARGERKRQFIYGVAGGAAGSLGSGLVTAFSGGTVGQSVSAGLLGQGGSHLVGSGGTMFSAKSAAALGPSVATPGAGAAAPTLVWQSVPGGGMIYAPAGVGTTVPGTMTSAGILAGVPVSTQMAQAAAAGIPWSEIAGGALAVGSKFLPGPTPTTSGGSTPGKPPGENAGGYDGSGGNPFGTINADGTRSPGMSPAVLAALALAGFLLLKG